MQSVDILARLVSFPTVSRTSNLELVGYIADFLRSYGVEAHILPGPGDDRDRANLFATIGPRSVPGIVLSGHLDVVPASDDGWRPFILTHEGDRLIGRGTADMKGFVAAVLASVPDFVRRPLTRPIHLAFSYDEEIGCIGVQHLLAEIPRLCALPEGAIIGEPSMMVPVLGHKGRISLRIETLGAAGHSSRPELGENAVHAMSGLLERAVGLANDLARSGLRDSAFVPPHSTLQVGVVQGGSEGNIIPQQCLMEIEARSIPADDLRRLVRPLMDTAAAIQREAGVSGRKLATRTTILSETPGMSIALDHPLSRLVVELSGNLPRSGVSYGTEGGRYQVAGIPAIICGPGDIDRAHKRGEFITRGELSACSEFLSRMSARLC